MILKKKNLYIFMFFLLFFNFTQVNSQSSSPIDKSINFLLQKDYKIIEIYDGRLFLLKKDKELIICNTRVVQNIETGENLKNYKEMDDELISRSIETRSNVLKFLYDEQLKSSINLEKAENFKSTDLFELLDIMDSIKTTNTMLSTCYKP
tara:strand:+ start:40 stop:489 length:450 start_codon:yes stop_codon:yes gene_type:complete